MAEQRPYRMSKRAENVAATRAQILDAARVMLREGAFDEAPLEDLAARAGVTRVTLYRAFGSKRGLLEAVFAAELARVRFDRLEAAHASPDIRLAVREVLRENCRMFADLRDAFPIMFDLARRSEDMAAIVDATYHGRRHRSMERLARRITRDGLAPPGWTTKRIADALIALTSYEVFETLTLRRRTSVIGVAATLSALAAAFLPEVASDR